MCVCVCVCVCACVLCTHVSIESMHARSLMCGLHGHRRTNIHDGECGAGASTRKRPLTGWAASSRGSNRSVLPPGGATKPPPPPAPPLSISTWSITRGERASLGENGSPATRPLASSRAPPYKGERPEGSAPAPSPADGGIQYQLIRAWLSFFAAPADGTPSVSTTPPRSDPR